VSGIGIEYLNGQEPGDRPMRLYFTGDVTVSQVGQQTRFEEMPYCLGLSHQYVVAIYGRHFKTLEKAFLGMLGRIPITAARINGCH